ncbi:unnamed protein product [Sphagnum balticum]
MPLPGVPREFFYEPSFEDLVCGWLFACVTPIFGNFEGRFGAFLIENSHRAEVYCGDCDLLVSGGLDAPVVRNFLELDHLGFANGRNFLELDHLGFANGCNFLELDHLGFAESGFDYEVDLVEWGASARSRVVNPVSLLRVADTFIEAPWDAGGYDVQASLVGCLATHS